MGLSVSLPVNTDAFNLAAHSTAIAHKPASSINWLLTSGRANAANKPDYASGGEETIGRSPLNFHRRWREAAHSFPTGSIFFGRSKDERRIPRLDERVSAYVSSVQSRAAL